MAKRWIRVSMELQIELADGQGGETGDVEDDDIEKYLHSPDGPISQLVGRHYTPQGTEIYVSGSYDKGVTYWDPCEAPEWAEK